MLVTLLLLLGQLLYFEVHAAVEGQILKDDAVKVLHSICPQIWKTQQ